MSEDDVNGEARWEHVRACYPTQAPLLNLNNAAVSPPPLMVEQAVVDAYRLISRNPDVNMWSKLDAALPEVKQQLAGLAGCSPSEIAAERAPRLRSLQSHVTPGIQAGCRRRHLEGVDLSGFIAAAKGRLARRHP